MLSKSFSTDSLCLKSLYKVLFFNEAIIPTTYSLPAKSACTFTLHAGSIKHTEQGAEKKGNACMSEENKSGVGDYAVCGCWANSEWAHTQSRKPCHVGTTLMLEWHAAPEANRSTLNDSLKETEGEQNSSWEHWQDNSCGITMINYITSFGSVQIIFLTFYMSFPKQSLLLNITFIFFYCHLLVHHTSDALTLSFRTLRLSPAKR